MIHRNLSFLIVLLLPLSLFGQTPKPELVLKAGEVRVESREDGFHLIVKQNPGVNSVMLVEAFELPDHKLATYSWKALKDYPSGANEKRLLNGQPLKGPNLFLVSSTVVPDPRFGPSFEVVIPPTIEFGSQATPGARYGKINVTEELAKTDGKLWFSIRTFAKPFEDYTGVYLDNAFELSTMTVVQDLPPDHGKYVKGAEDLLKRLGPVEKALDAADGVKRLESSLQNSTDVVWAIDTTKSMKQDLQAIRETLVPELEDLTSSMPDLNLGFLFYRDYQELYLTKAVPLFSDRAAWKKTLLEAVADAGGDVPEATVEGAWAAVDLFAKSPAGRKRSLVLFADAPQHDVARGKVTEGQLAAKLQAAGVPLRIILLPLTTF